MTRHGERRAPHRAPAISQLDDVGRDLAVFAAVAVGCRCNLQGRSAVAGLMSTALSHVSLVIGFGSSCSQPLLAKRPSSTAGS